MLLCKNLANFRMSRVKANELNIYARGGASQVKDHLNTLKQHAANVKLKVSID